MSTSKKKGRIKNEPFCDENKLVEVGVAIVEEFFADDSYQVSPVKLRRLNDKRGRLYARPVTGAVHVAPSVTNVLDRLPMNEYLLKWACDMGYDESKAYARERAGYGTFLHIIFAQILAGETIRLDKGSLLTKLAAVLDQENKQDLFETNCDQWARDIQKDLVGLVQWVKDFKVKPIAVEFPVWAYHLIDGNPDDLSDARAFASVIDLVCKASFPNQETDGDGKTKTVWTEKTLVVDFKGKRGSATYIDNELQLAAMKFAFEETTGMQIDEVYNYKPKDWKFGKKNFFQREPYHFINQTRHLERNLNWFRILLEQWHLEGPIEIDERRILIEKEISLGAKVESYYSKFDIIENLMAVNSVEN